MKTFAAIIGLICLSQSLYAKVVADFIEDFEAHGSDTSWSYQWNPEGVKLGEHDKYVDLKSPQNKYKLVVDPEQLPSKECTVPNAQWLQIRKGILSPGNAASLSTDQLDHYAIASYTIQAGEEGEGYVTNSRIERKSDKGFGKISIYVNDRLIGSDRVTGTVASAFDVPLGQLNAGDIVYLAFGPGDTSAISAKVQFQIETK